MMTKAIYKENVILNKHSVQKIDVFRRPCVVGNWKMNGSKASILTLMKEIFTEGDATPLDWSKMDISVCPPFTYLQLVREILNSDTSKFKAQVQIGAQDVYWESNGAFTGEISTSMLIDLNCRFVIIGHSERRRLMGESNELIARKFRAAYDAGLTPILCVGETLTERESGETMEVIHTQITKVLEVMPVHAFQKAIIAYEPVWAIGTGNVATPDQAEEVHAFIRQGFYDVDPETAKELRILYGGSLKAETALDLFSKPNIDGGLIGGASLKGEEFLGICKSAMSRTLWKTSS